LTGMPSGIGRSDWPNYPLSASPSSGLPTSQPFIIGQVPDKTLEGDQVNDETLASLDENEDRSLFHVLFWSAFFLLVSCWCFIIKALRLRRRRFFPYQYRSTPLHFRGIPLPQETREQELPIVRIA
jgi:hypothetical protein